MAIHGSSEPPHHPWTPPAPWVIEIGSLRTLEPDALDPADPVWGWFTDDLLAAKHPDGWWLDVGWLPDGDPAGRFVLLLVRGDDWLQPVERFETRSLVALIERMDAFCLRVPAPG
jgi:hypothetical protein